MIRGGPESFEAREKHLRDGRDLARDVAATVEEQNALASSYHEPTLYCLGHSVTNHACGTGWVVRCSECAQEYRDGKPCRTFRALNPEWETPRAPAAPKQYPSLDELAWTTPPRETP